MDVVNRRYLFLLVLINAFSVQAQEPTIDRPPNIILIMADDLGTEAVGCYGGTSYDTPVMDKMAKAGVRFNHAYSYPLCTPTRVSLMTGKYNFRNWKAFGILDPEEKTFGHYLQEEGFKTCMVGKWQLQSYDPPGYPGGDLRRNTGMKVEDAGFDEYCMWHTRTNLLGPLPGLQSGSDLLKRPLRHTGPSNFQDRKEKHQQHAKSLWEPW